MRKIYLILMLLVTASLFGCTESNKEFFTYGLAKSCFQKEKPFLCNLYEANDKLTVSVNQARQEVTYQLSASRLDDTNTIFKTMSLCNVIDVNNFSCEGLVVVDGVFKDTKEVGYKLVSRVSWLYFFSDKFDEQFKKETIQFIDINNGWLVPALVVSLFIVFLTMS